MYAYQLCKHAGITQRQRKYWTDKGILRHPVLDGKAISCYHAREAFIAALASYLIKKTPMTTQCLKEFVERLDLLEPERRELADCTLVILWTKLWKGGREYELLLSKRRIIFEMRKSKLQTTVLQLIDFWPEEFR